MLTVDELFQKLSYSELSNLAVALDGAGNLKKERQNQIIHLANDGLLKIQQKTSMQAAVSYITLQKEVDTEATLEGLLSIISIMTPYGQSLPFTLHSTPNEISINGSVITIPSRYAKQTSELQITYRVAHPKLRPIVEPADLEQEIQIPPSLEEALTSYIAWKVYSSMNSQEANSTAQFYFQRHMQVLGELSQIGAFTEEPLPTHKLTLRGFP